ncbi:enoyl-CoA hydratase/isomerase family protein [bacterium]|nr:enoyl-CoA hydratase/isomerase family protein [bacterium]
MIYRIDLVKDVLWIEADAVQKYAVLNFSAQHSRNAMSMDMANALAQMAHDCTQQNSSNPLAQLIYSQKILALVLKSHCRNIFMSGGDLKAISKFNAHDGEIFTHKMRSFTHFLRTGPLISIAFLNGLAAGGGSEIALAADLRIALTSDVTIELAQTRWGVPAGWGMMTDLASKGIYSSERRRSIAVISQESWDLKKLLDLGLIDANFVGNQNPESSAQIWLEEFLKRISACPNDLRHELLINRPNQPHLELEEFDKKLFSRHWLSAEHRARVTTFIESRTEKKKGAPKK